MQSDYSQILINPGEHREGVATARLLHPCIAVREVDDDRQEWGGVAVAAGSHWLSCGQQGQLRLVKLGRVPGR